MFSEPIDILPSTAEAIFDIFIVLSQQAVESARTWDVGAFCDTVSLF
jgi:hypothetical protein